MVRQNSKGWRKEVLGSGKQHDALDDKDLFNWGTKENPAYITTGGKTYKSTGKRKMRRVR